MQRETVTHSGKLRDDWAQLYIPLGSKKHFTIFINHCFGFRMHSCFYQKSSAISSVQFLPSMKMTVTATWWTLWNIKQVKIQIFPLGSQYQPKPAKRKVIIGFEFRITAPTLWYVWCKNKQLIVNFINFIKQMTKSLRVKSGCERAHVGKQLMWLSIKDKAIQLQLCAV